MLERPPTTASDTTEIEGSGGEPWREHVVRITAGWQKISQCIIAVANDLLKAKDELDHGDFEQMVNNKLPFGPRTAQMLMSIAKHPVLVNPKHASLLPASWYTLAILARLKPARLERLIADGTVNADMKREDATALLGRAVAQQFFGDSASSEKPETECGWFTPQHILDLVVEVFGGGIDCDPSWSPDSLVRAKLTFDKHQNGLAHKWRGRTFLNPPYDNKGIKVWVQKLLVEHASGRVPEAIAMLPACTDTAWFGLLSDYPCCFMHRRVQFKKLDGGNGEIKYPSALFYLGGKIHRFARIFSKVGFIYIRWDWDFDPDPEESDA
jgi:hypothetical protein